MQHDILLGICVLVQEYPGSSAQERKINANLMIPVHPSHPDFQSALSHVRFLEETYRGWPLNPDWSKKYLCLVQILQWATDDHDVSDERVAFPVHGDRHNVLFGAPYAYLRGTKYYLEDSRNPKIKLKLPTGIDDKVEEEIVQHLTVQQSSRSFVSICLTHDDSKVGVLNIQADVPSAFGKGHVEQQLITDLGPLIDVLGLCVATAVDKGLI